MTHSHFVEIDNNNVGNILQPIFEKGFDGVFIAADGTDCSYSETCTKNTGEIVTTTHNLMKEKNLDPAKLKMAAICSVCSDPFVKHMKNFVQALSEPKD